MPRRPQAVTYRQALSALRDAHQTITLVLVLTGLPAAVREPLRLLADRLELIVARDNGRSR